jgi:ankyrin repeat protein
MQSGVTALILAAREGHADCVRLLIDSGAEKEDKTNVRAVAYFLYTIACLQFEYYGLRSRFLNVPFQNSLLRVSSMVFACT